MARAFRCIAPLLVAQLVVATAWAQSPPDPLAALDGTIAAAEWSIRSGEFEIAESRYRSALLEAWMIMGGLHVAAGRLPEARDAFQRATHAAVDADAAFRSLAAVHLHTRDTVGAITLLTRLLSRTPGDLQTRRLLAQALVANGQPGEAVQTLEEARAAQPDNPEIAFLLASGYLRLKKLEAAERLFAEVAAARPIAPTWVLIGRTYRDAGFYDLARKALKLALGKDPAVARAHYYLGTVAVMQDGVLRLDEAIGEFRKELMLTPDDPVTNLRLGMALVEAGRPEQALRALESAARLAPSAEALHYLGRCQLALDRVADAVTSLRRALDLASTAGAYEARLRNIHYQLALALRRAGSADEAAIHFNAAKDASGRHTEAQREELGRYLTDTTAASSEAAPFPLESPFTALAPAARAEIERRVRTALARAYQNLGVMRAQTQQFARAAAFFVDAAAADPEFPQVQYSLGVAYFNAQDFTKAIGPLRRALDADPGNASVRRMLALAQLNAEAYADAATLLADDPARASDPSLQYAYGLALVRSNRAAEAEAVFTRLLTEHPGNAELHVIVGQAQAQQGDYASAVRSLERARELKPDVRDAHAALGMIYMKQGKLADAAMALGAELRVNPANLTARHTLATVLDLNGESAEAAALLRDVLARKPDFGDARYLLGKILLAQGDAQAAIAQLETAVRLSPDSASYHYQLAQAYLKIGRRDLADRHFAAYRELKDKRRGGTP